TSSGMISVECYNKYEVGEGVVKLTSIWIQSGEGDCPSSQISEFKMELAENFLLIEGAELVEPGYLPSTGFVMVFRR
ncbi:hypothetical protein OAA91_01655, partial [Fibrobacterales bacterium]|nr:hypothetical protein [Fibrobacterales bacterium]